VKNGGREGSLGHGAVPQRDVALSVVDNRTELGVVVKVVHQVLHPTDALGEVDDLFLVRFGVERFDNVVDGLGENRGESDTHRRMSEGVLVVATVRGPGLYEKRNVRRKKDQMRERKGRTGLLGSTRLGVRGYWKTGR
jgi:hypothetical protein